MKKIILSLLTIYYLFIPISVFAYSDYIIASGQNIGIELKTDYVLIVGSYKIKDYNVLQDTDLKIGDKITKIDNITVSSIKEMLKTIDNLNKSEVEVTYIRNDKEYKENISIYKENGENKTGLYVKDTIRGVATLTYIDIGETNNNNDIRTNIIRFGALGHDVTEKSTKRTFESTSGVIVESKVTGITKSNNGNPGEKNAVSNYSNIYGEVEENTKSGVFGTYNNKIENKKLYKVVKPDEIKLGKAQILTTIEGNKVEAFDINIIRINQKSDTKNILFEVIDKKLLETTGGIVQGMSGSPIIQGDNIIGAVNYVVVDSPKTGYGIFITNMLEEAEN